MYKRQAEIPAVTAQLPEWQVTLHLYVQAWGHSCTHYFLTQRWVYLRILGEECQRTTAVTQTCSAWSLRMLYVSTHSCSSRTQNLCRSSTLPPVSCHTHTQQQFDISVKMLSSLYFEASRTNNCQRSYNTHVSLASVSSCYHHS